MKNRPETSDENAVSFVPQTVTIGGGSSGISIRYTKSSRRVFISGWYDSFVGIQGAHLDLEELLLALGVSAADLSYMLKRVQKLERYAAWNLLAKDGQQCFRCGKPAKVLCAHSSASGLCGKPMCLSHTHEHGGI